MASKTRKVVVIEVSGTIYYGICFVDNFTKMLIAQNFVKWISEGEIK